MTFGRRYTLSLLFFGDLLVFCFSLVLTLLLRYGGFPSEDIVRAYVGAFSILFIVWLLVFYMAGLYSKQVLLYRSGVPQAILRTQIFNIIIAALLFFFAPGIGIAPKTSLAIYLVISLLCIFIWRLWIFPKLSKPVVRERAALLGQGPEVEEFVEEVNSNPRYHLEFVLVENPATLIIEQFDTFVQELSAKQVTLVVVDSEHETTRLLLPAIYKLTASGRFQYADFHQLYEEVFDRVPLSHLRYDWFLKNITVPKNDVYAFVKRAVDIVGALVMGVATVVVTPLLFILMKLEGPGPVFIAQERLGEGDTRMRAYKFRSMRLNNSASREWITEEKQKNPITAVGSVLRKTSLDEFPQFINILKGEMSLVGPRNDIEGLGLRLAEELPYYGVRYMVKPGLTGWAQINQKYEQGNISPQSIEETKVRLAYDFYYIKHRSLALDLVIALKTVKRMLFRVSSW